MGRIERSWNFVVQILEKLVSGVENFPGMYFVCRRIALVPIPGFAHIENTADMDGCAQCGDLDPFVCVRT